MKLIVIDDDERMVKLVIKTGTKAGFQTFGWTQSKLFNDQGEIESDPMDVIRGADVILLDHGMPTQGNVLLAELRHNSVVTEATRVIGISASRSSQPYLKEHASFSTLVCVERLRSLIEGEKK